MTPGELQIVLPTGRDHAGFLGRLSVYYATPMAVVTGTIPRQVAFNYAVF